MSARIFQVIPINLKKYKPPSTISCEHWGLSKHLSRKIEGPLLAGCIYNRLTTKYFRYQTWIKTNCLCKDNLFVLKGLRFGVRASGVSLPFEDRSCPKGFYGDGLCECDWSQAFQAFRGRSEQNWGSFSGSVSCRGRFRDHFSVGNNFVVGDHFRGCTGVRMQSFINLG